MHAGMKNSQAFTLTLPGFSSTKITIAWMLTYKDITRLLPQQCYNGLLTPTKAQQDCARSLYVNHKQRINVNKFPCRFWRNLVNWAEAEIGLLTGTDYIVTASYEKSSPILGNFSIGNDAGGKAGLTTKKAANASCVLQNSLRCFFFVFVVFRSKTTKSPAKSRRSI